MRDSHVEEFIASHRSELFSELKEEIADDRITDIEWDGYNLWITHLDHGSYLSKKKLTAAFVDNLSIRLANIMMVSFNRSVPVLEANTEDLRISIWHESRCGKTFVSASIRDLHMPAGKQRQICKCNIGNSGSIRILEILQQMVVKAQKQDLICFCESPCLLNCQHGFSRSCATLNSCHTLLLQIIEQIALLHSHSIKIIILFSSFPGEVGDGIKTGSQNANNLIRFCF